jgi:SAM-dependent methyltransferase
MKRRVHVDLGSGRGRLAALHAVPPPAAPAIPDSAGALNQGGDANAAVAADLPVARLIGRDKRVLVVGRRVRGLCRALVTAGCSVSAAPESRSVALGRKLPAGPFDAVALVRLVEYIDDPVGLLRRIARLLTPDGYVVAAVPNITHGSVRLRLLAGEPPPASFEPDAPSAWRCYGGAAVRQLFERAGFVVTETERCREAFDCHPNVFKETVLPMAFVQELASDIDALTSAFVVVAHKSPLSSQVELQLQVRQLARAGDADRRRVESVHNRQDEQDARLARLDSRQAEVANELSDLRRTAVSESELQPHLSTARSALIAQTVEAEQMQRDLKQLQYRQLTARISATVNRSLPRAAVVLVVSKGDPRLVDFRERIGWHFLQTRDGEYAGHHPADSAAAIDALKLLRAKGADYLLFPRTSLWWLDHYAAFAEYLNKRFRVVVRDERTCVIYALAKKA